MMLAPRFLSVEEVREIHTIQLRRFGGGDGVRDTALLESAVAQARLTFGGVYVHASIYEMAAAYLFHIVKNHPFVDGNKRAGLLAALTFLDLNSITLLTHSDELYDLTIGVAEGRISKAAVAVELERLVKLSQSG